MGSDWRERNQANWNERVAVHVDSAFYDVQGWLAGRDSLQPFELEEVGDVTGKQLVHLQCHFGMDTLSWARHGAKVTGLDFSQPAIDAASALAKRASVPARFVCSDVYSAPDALGDTYDIVYTSHGVLGWLPDLDRWAAVVAALLKPGGLLYLSEFHPISWCIADDGPRRFGESVEHDYFAAEPLHIEESGTYADRDAPTTHNRTVEFQHTLGSIVSAVCGQGLRVAWLRERRETLFPQFPWLVADPTQHSVYRQPEGQPQVPLMFSLRAHKP